MAINAYSCSKKIFSSAAILATLGSSSLPQLAHSFVHVTPTMSSLSTHSLRRLDQADDRPAPFVTASATGTTIESALGSLRAVVRREMGAAAGSSQGERPRCEMGVLFYTHFDGSGVQDALAEFHAFLPFVDQIIASPTHATSTSEGCETDQPPEGFTATITLINNPDVKVDSFVMSPPSPSGHTLPSSSLEEEHIKSTVVRALEWSAGASDGSAETCPIPREPDQFDVVCLAFGADASMELDNADSDDSCISQLHRLNSLLRESDHSVSSVNSRASTHPGVSRCPLVASVMSGRKGGVFVSSRDEESGECSAAAGSVVGAILSGSRDSLTSFQLMHAGKHLALRGSQFEIKHMKDGKIAEVAPVLSMESSPSSTAAAVTAAAGGPTGDGQSWPRPRCNGGSVSAAEWCQQVVASSTYFEKLAMQSALGVGVLRRVGTDNPYRDSGSGSDGLFGGFTTAPVGVMPCLPAQSCFDVQEVELDGSLRLSQESPLVELREGDLCDFRAVGTLASLQAEQDAYTWLHASRMSSAIRHMGDEKEQPCGGLTHSTVVQGCLVASTRARFPGGLEGEGCQEVVRCASGPVGCPTVGSVSDVQLVSVDNTMVTCSSTSGLAGVYVCGSVRGYEETSSTTAPSP